MGLPTTDDRGSIASTGSIACLLGIGSIASLASVGSIASVGSVGSIASVGSIYSIGSRGQVGAFFGHPVLEPAVRAAVDRIRSWRARRR